MDKAILGLDIGGTGIKGGILINGHLADIRTIPTPADQDHDHILETIAQFIESYTQYDFVGIGIGIPGLVNAEKGIVLNLSNIPAFQHVELKDFIENRFSKPVFINNDANCFALGVHKFGVGRKFNNIVGLTLGTGLGGGIVIHGHLYGGVHSAAGEWCSVNYLDKDFENYCSSKFFLNHYNSKPKPLAKRAILGDDIAMQAFVEYGKHIGELIKHIMYALAPEAIILGGSIRKSYPLFKDSMHKTVSTFNYPTVLENVQILLSELDETAIHGAVALVELEEESVKLSSSI